VLGGPLLLSTARKRAARAAVPDDSHPLRRAHPSTRISTVARLAAVDWAEFSFIRDEAGGVTIERPLSDWRPRVRARLTPAGRTGFDGHVAALRAIVGPAVA
jgi:hypothetical protein